MKYGLIVCGGTFDLLHKGHKKFLKDILNLSENVLLGITSDFYIAKFKNPEIEKFEVRKRSVLDFIESIGASDRIEIVSIDQAYEPLLTSKFSPKAIAVTPQTEKTAIEINQKRKELGLDELIIEIVEMEKAEDGDLISSTRIRSGEINRKGRLYVNPSWADKTLILPETLRSELHKPFGKLHKSIPSALTAEKIVIIGDVSTQRFNQANVGQFLSIVDFQVKRQKKFKKLSQLGFDNDIKTIKTENKHGTISPELFGSVRKAFQGNKKQVILVNGEEDLSFLPVMLASPLGFTVFYGQPTFAKASAGKPDEGLVEVLVTEENKEKVYDLINKFKFSS